MEAQQVSPASQPSFGSAPADNTLLIVDDDRAFLARLARAMETRGFEVEAAASVPDPRDLLEAQREVFLDPFDPAVQEQALRDGIPEDWLDYARRSPVRKLAVDWRLALPLHPEYRTLPMVWYVPPLSPVQGAAEGDEVFAAIEQLRIPVEYLASLFTAGDPEPVLRALRRLAAMRAYMRAKTVDGAAGEDAELEEMYRLLSIAKYRDRFVIPPGRGEEALALAGSGCGDGCG